tara:strand:+ start:62 stop:457 length:396 start_codon:yes stop_codon:yes gene_type:complete
MSKYLLQILVLAASSDGDIQKEERALMIKYREHHPSLKNIDPDEFNQIISDVSKKIVVGMKHEYILEDMINNISDDEKITAYALAYEVCASNFIIAKPEQDFLSLIKEKWKISKIDHDAIVRSVKIRYQIT